MKDYLLLSDGTYLELSDGTFMEIDDGNESIIDNCGCGSYTEYHTVLPVLEVAD